MKKKNKIKNAAKKLYNLFVLDRSGSMMGLRQSTIESVNGQIESLRSDAKKNENVSILCSLLLFDSRGDDSFHFCYVNTPVGDVKNITEADYLPNGGTPLRDAIGVGIQRLQRELGDSIGHDDVNILVTSILQTPAGRMIFGKIKNIINKSPNDFKSTVRLSSGK